MSLTTLRNKINAWFVNAPLTKIRGTKLNEVMHEAINNAMADNTIWDLFDGTNLQKTEAPPVADEFSPGRTYFVIEDGDFAGLAVTKGMLVQGYVIDPESYTTGFQIIYTPPAGSGGVQSVNGWVDNSDPLNPIVPEGDPVGSAELALTNANAYTDESVYRVINYDDAISLIDAGGLKIGALYKITGFHPTLYNDGTVDNTTVYLKAISNNSFEKRGVGVFYNPPYDQTSAGFNIWTQLGQYSAAIISGTFNVGETITGNGGQTGTLFGFLDSCLFRPISGDWSTATEITGDVSGATASFALDSVPSYSIGDKVIWGGYLWSNVNGLVGGSVDSLNLNAEWEKVQYDSGLYNKVEDEVVVDFENNFIISRHNVESNNFVSCTLSRTNSILASIASSYGYPLYSTPINVFQWGNIYNVDLNVGFIENIVNDSFIDLVNFRGDNIRNNMFDKNSFISDRVVLLRHSSIDNCLLKSTSFDLLKFYNVAFSRLDLDNLTISQSTISQATFNNCKIVGCSFQFWYFSNLTFEFNEIFSHGIYSGIDFFGFTYDGKTITGLEMKSGTLSGDFTSATVLFDSSTFKKEVFRIASGATKLSYYDSSSVLQVINPHD